MLRTYRVVKFNNLWCVRDEKDKRFSSWFRTKSEAYSAKVDLVEQPTPKEAPTTQSALPDSYQFLYAESDRFIKFQKGKYSTKKGPGAYKNIQIIDRDLVLNDFPRLGE